MSNYDKWLLDMADDYLSGRDEVIDEPDYGGIEEWEDE